jgi:hypothetical protein
VLFDVDDLADGRLLLGGAQHEHHRDRMEPERDCRHLRDLGERLHAAGHRLDHLRRGRLRDSTPNYSHLAIDEALAEEGAIAVERERRPVVAVEPVCGAQARLEVADVDDRQRPRADPAFPDARAGRGQDQGKAEERVPPPGFHMTRYYGVFASHHRLREHVIPRPAAPPPPPQLALDFAHPDDPAESSPTSSPRPRRIAWAKLLARVFAIDITRCRKCGGRMRVLEVVSDADAIARILHGARAPPAPPPLGQVLLFP